MVETSRPLPPGLLPSDEWLIQMVREGRVDADIGGELGLSAGEVRERIATVASKLDVAGRAGIQRYFGVESGHGPNAAPGGGGRQFWRPRRLLWLGAAVVALGAIGTVTALALTRGSGSSQTPANATADAQTAIAAAVFATASAENPNGWYDAGPLLFVDGTTQPVLATSVRALFTAVTMAGPGLIEFNAGNVKWLGQQSAGTDGSEIVNAEINGFDEALIIQPGDNTRVLSDATNTIRFFGINGSQRPVLFVRSLVPERGAYRVGVGADGRLFIDAAPVADDAVINQDTGEQLDASKATRLGPEPSNVAITRCGGAISHDDGGRCYVEWLSGDALVAPVGGVLTCLPDGSWQLRAAAVVLNFAGSDPTLPPTTTGPLVRCVQPMSGSSTVDAGYQIFDHGTAFRITATTLDGATPVSVAIGDDGAMYVGLIPVTIGCPCLQAGP